jgi:phosphatidylglycerol:prolipoprotein diacylglycerol transferase
MHPSEQTPQAAVMMYVLAYVAGIAAFAIAARRRGLATDGIAVIAASALLAGALGAQVTQMLLGGVPGKSLLGGVASGFVAVILVKRALGIVRPTGDLFAFAIATGETIGRIGCFFAGCCYGKATHAAWGVMQHDGLRHPTQLYSAFAAATTLAIIVVLERKRALPENGLFYVQGALLCASRFVIEYFREGPQAALGFTTAQIACAIGFAFFAYRLSGLVARTSAREDVRVATQPG